MKKKNTTEIHLIQMRVFTFNRHLLAQHAHTRENGEKRTLPVCLCVGG